MPKNKAELDRKLYQYTRQLKAPKEFEAKFPNISKTVDPYLLHKSDEDIYNTIGSKMGSDDSINKMDIYGKAGQYLRDSETAASNSLNSDIYKSETPQDLINKLSKEDKLKYEAEFDGTLPDKLYGAFSADENKIFLNPNKSKEDIVDTIIHENEHAKDYVKKFNPTSEENFSDYIGNIKEAYKNDDLYKLSENFSKGHFQNPRSASINRLINKSTEAGNSLGFERQPDLNPEYQDLDYIKEQLKASEDYSMPEKMNTFEKIKRYLSK